MSINIHEKISNIKDYLTIKNAGSLSAIYKSELIRGEDTFLKRLIKSGENFILISGTYQLKKWKRFARVEVSDYFYMSDGYFDAVAFKPKKNVHFLGFGFCN